MLSTFANLDYVREAIEAKASGYLLKDATVIQLQQAIDTAIEGRGLYLDPRIAESLTRGTTERKPSDRLTTRELEVLRALARGATNEQIAALLHVSSRTVKFHVTGLLRKLGVANRTEAASIAIREGLTR